MVSNIFKKVDKSLVIYWKENGLSQNDFYCRTCGKLMLDLSQLDGLRIRHYVDFHKTPKVGLFTSSTPIQKITPNETNRWLVLGRTLSGTTYFRHLCWNCFFDKLFAEDKDIKQKARKGKWYAKIANGARVIPAASTSPSFYFKWLFDISDEALEVEKKKFDTASLESFIRRYGHERGLEKFEAYAKRQAYTCSKEYLGMTDEEFKAFNASRASTKENFIKRYGFTLGTKRWNEYCAYESYAGSSLKWFIDKYGEEAGKSKYDELCASKIGFAGGYSKVSQELFAKIDSKLGDYAKESRWAEKNHEFEIFGEIATGIKKILKVDYFLNGKVIEFNGDFWHANPTMYESGSRLKMFDGNEKIADDIWDRDARRLKAIESLGYKVLVVWESDYKNNPDGELKRCLDFLGPQT